MADGELKEGAASEVVRPYALKIHWHAGLSRDAAVARSEAFDPGVAPSDEEAYFRSVFDEFVELKNRCGESTSGLTYAKFVEKLRKNKDDLMGEPGTVGVRFQVYVKDGKAALKATPVNDG